MIYKAVPGPKVLTIKNGDFSSATNAYAELINAERDRLITSFITKNYDNVLGAGVFMLLTSNFPYPILNPQIETVLGMGTPYFLENAYVKEYVKIATENMEKLREEEQQ